MTTPKTAAPPGDLETLTAAAWDAYHRIKGDRSQRLQAYQLLKAMAMSRDLMNGDRIHEPDRSWLRSIFASEPPEGPARSLWSESKAPEAVELYDYLRRQGHL